MNGHESHHPTGTILGTIVGTSFTVLGNISSADILKTVVLAGLGAVVSFGVSVGLKRVFRK